MHASEAIHPHFIARGSTWTANLSFIDEYELVVHGREVDAEIAFDGKRARHVKRIGVVDDQMGVRRSGGVKTQRPGVNAVGIERAV